jgi:ribosomal protein S18 acetylase RimI-like enzyme
MGEINPEKLRIERLKESHNLSSFDCGDEELNKFLIEDALRNQREGTSVTYLVFNEGEESPIGYYSILNDSIELRKSQKRKFLKKTGISYEKYPATKIGRFCINCEYQKMNVGDLILRRLIGDVKEYGANVGTRFVTLDAKKDPPHIIKFYKDNGFTELIVKDGGKMDKTTILYLDLYE